MASGISPRDRLLQPLGPRAPAAQLTGQAQPDRAAKGQILPPYMTSGWSDSPRKGDIKSPRVLWQAPASLSPVAAKRRAAAEAADSPSAASMTMASSGISDFMAFELPTQAMQHAWLQASLHHLRSTRARGRSMCGCRRA